MLELRPYQTETVLQVRNALAKFRRVLLQCPTGGGKTAMATDMVHRAVSREKTVFFICHRQELIRQTTGAFTRAGLDRLSFIASGLPYNERARVHICGVDTLRGRVSHVVMPDLCIWDEAHHMGAKTWAGIQDIFCGAHHVGLSATPERLDGKGLTSAFDHMVLGPRVSWLIENGYLSDYTLYCPGKPDLTEVHTLAGDYNRGELSGAMDTAKITGDIIAHWNKHARGKKTICFAVSIQHSEHIAAQFRAAGIMAVHVDGKTDDATRMQVARSFASGDIQVLCNVELFGEGYDLSAQAGTDVTVDCVIQARPTQSLALHLQQVGRALRPKRDGSKAIILDHAGNCYRHGLPDDDREWALAGREKQTKKEKEAAEKNIKQCPKCYAINGVMARSCKQCGESFAVKSRILKTEDGILEELDRAAFREHVRQGRLQSVEELVDALGYTEARARHIIAAREEKHRLQTELFNLARAASMGGYARAMSKADVYKLKPAQLKAEIEILKNSMRVTG